MSAIGPAGIWQRPLRLRAGWTVLECLFALGLAALLGAGASSIWSGAWRDGARTSNQARLEADLAFARDAARLRQATVGWWVADLPSRPDLHYRLAGVAIQSPEGAWLWLRRPSVLAGGMRLMPSSAEEVAAWIEAEERPHWRRPSDGSSLRSTALRAHLAGAALPLPPGLGISKPERWVGCRFSPEGTTMENGDLVLAEALPSGRFRQGAEDRVLGCALSVYGAWAAVDSRSGF